MRCRPTVPVLFTAAVLSGGCVTDDFRDLGEVFTPKTPRQAALEALDPYNPDLRREGVVLLANAPFGGADIYLSIASSGDPCRPRAVMAAARTSGSVSFST